ncbi:thiol-activated cytolysin family protein [Sphingobacterium daejeonense]|uniref:Thiol-activated cytolysin family protein n=1 Tax=Sphingobacterium daejeonense TaxID=371142 RepID=A0ABW3RLK5_9SPHI
MSKKLFRIPATITRVKPKFDFSKVKINQFLTQKIDFSPNDKVTLSFKRDLKQYTNANQEITGSDNSPGWKCAIGKTSGTWASNQVIETNFAISKIFLGGVYQMKELVTGNANTVPYARKPLYLLVDSHHFQDASVKVENPYKHEIREAINKIIRSKDMPDIAFTHGSIKEFQSYSSLLTNFSGTGHFLGFGGSHDISFDSKRKTHKFYLECKQLYYTVSVSNTIKEPEDFFYIKEEDPTVEDAVPRNNIDPNWVFVDSVGYGRLLYLIFESDESYEGMEMDLEQYADYWLASAKLNESVQKKVQENNVSVQVVAMGGSHLIALSLADSSPESIKKTIQDYLKGTNDEVPISYSLCTLDMHSVGTSMFVDYVGRQCHLSPTKHKVIWETLIWEVNDVGGEGEDVKAMVRIRAFDKNNKDILDEDKFNQNILKVIERTAL